MASERAWYHWSIVIPIAALVACAAGFCVAQRAPPRELSIQVAPTPANDLPAIVLPPRAREIAGRVVGPDGAPVDDALVWLVAGDEPHWTTSGVDGSFAFASLQRGPWTLYVVAHGREPFQTTVADADDARTIRLPDLQRAPTSLPAIARTRLSGRIEASPNAKLEGLEIALVPVASIETLGAPVPRRTSSDASGAFVFEELVAGDYRAWLLPAWASGGSWPDLAREWDAPLAELVSVAKEGANEVVLRHVGGALRGRLVELDGSPVEGALVLVHPEGDPSKPWPPVSSRADGEFVRDELPPGRYVVRVRAGAATATRTVEVRERDTAFVETQPLATAKPAAK